MEPWDGPASILFSDGDVVGAVLDRNGLRPSRYYVTSDGRLILSSEVGGAGRARRGDCGEVPAPAGADAAGGHRPGPHHRRRRAEGALRGPAAPYGEWLDANLLHLRDLPIPNKRVERHSREELRRLQKAFGYTYEDVRSTILPMARTGAEPTAAMAPTSPWRCWTAGSSPCSTTSSSSSPR